MVEFKKKWSLKSMIKGISWKWLILAVLLKFYKDNSRILMFLIFSCLSLADLKLADIGLTNENAASSDGTACNSRIQKQHQNLMLFLNSWITGSAIWWCCIFIG